MSELDADAVRAFGRARGLDLPAEHAERLAREAGPLLAEFRAIAGRLRADDDLHAFRRLLEREAGE